jgi:hypothetical protein
MIRPFIQLILSIIIGTLSLYNYLDNLNDLTLLRLRVPQMQHVVSLLQIDYQEKSHQWRKLIGIRQLLEVKNKESFNHLRIWRSPQNFSREDSPEDSKV